MEKETSKERHIQNRKYVKEQVNAVAIDLFIIYVSLLSLSFLAVGFGVLIKWLF